MHDLARTSWVGPIVHRSCTASHNGTLGSIDYLDRDLSDLSDLGNRGGCVLVVMRGRSRRTTDHGGRGKGAEPTEVNSAAL